MPSDILSYPAILDQVQRYAERLAADAARIEKQLEAMEQGGYFSRTASAQLFAETTPAIKLIGVLLQVSKPERLSTLTADGGLTLEAAQRALRAVERLEKLTDLRRELAQVLPSWFHAPEESDFPTLSLPPPASVSCLAAMWETEAKKLLYALLRPLNRQGLISLSHSIDLSLNIEQQIEELDVLMVLISPALMADEKAVRALAQALDPQRERALQVVPVLVEPTDLEGSTLATRQLLPMDGQPVLTRPYPSEAWLDVTQGIRRLAKHIRAQRRQGSASASTPSGSPARGSAAPLVTVLYDPSDRDWFKELEQHLVPLQRAGQLALWHPGLILPGATIPTELKAQVGRAEVIIPLLSSAFLASERLLAPMEHAQERKGSASIFPVYLRPVDPSDTLSYYTTHENLVLMPGKSSRDEGWTEVIAKLRKRLRAGASRS